MAAEITSWLENNNLNSDRAAILLTIKLLATMKLKKTQIANKMLLTNK